MKFRLPSFLEGKTVQAELSYGKLMLTVSREAEPMKGGDKVGAVDLGVIHLAMVTDGQSSLAVVGRVLRSIKQGRAKALADLAALQSGCTKGSRRWRKLQRSKCALSRKVENQSRNPMHHAANQVIKFAVTKGIGKLLVGDGISEMNNDQSGKKSRWVNRKQGRSSLAG